MSARLWNVRRAWWELTKLVLARRGGYDLYVHVDDLSSDAQNEFNDASWAAYHLDWVGGGDRYAVLSAEPEQGAPVARPGSTERVAELEKQLSTEQMTTAQLNSQLKLQANATRIGNLRLESAVEELKKVRADAEFVAAERCECGGDTELYWRRRAHAAEQQAHRDRDNARRMVDEVTQLRLIADEAERLHHVIELGRAGIAVVS